MQPTFLHDKCESVAQSIAGVFDVEVACVPHEIESSLVFAQAINATCVLLRFTLWDADGV